jgi:hypothetical protein
MPNWCSNTIEIIGDHESLEYIKSTNFDFSILRPIPEQTTDWYAYCLEHWGTKWSPDVFQCEIEDQMLKINCRSAWSPPIALLQHLSEKYNLQINIDFIGEMYEYVGHSTIRNGKEQTEYINPDDHDDTYVHQYASSHQWFPYDDWRRFNDEMAN